MKFNFDLTDDITIIVNPKNNIEISQEILDLPVVVGVSAMAQLGLDIQFVLKNDHGTQTLNVWSNEDAHKISDNRNNLTIDVGMVYKAFDKLDPETFDDFYHKLFKVLNKLAKKTRRVKQKHVINQFIDALREGIN